MKLNLLKPFVALYYKGWCVWLAVGIILSATHVLNFGAYSFFLIVSILRDAYHFKDRIARIKKLKSRGLTETDITNIEFTKKWAETRNGGIWKYCIKDGAVIAGVFLALPGAGIIQLINSDIVKKASLGPGNMMVLICYCYFVGAILGIILYRILWIINQRRFLRLTDPLNTIFTDKKESFSDLL